METVFSASLAMPRVAARVFPVAFPKALSPAAFPAAFPAALFPALLPKAFPALFPAVALTPEPEAALRAAACSPPSALLVPGAPTLSLFFSMSCTSRVSLLSSTGGRVGSSICRSTSCEQVARKMLMSIPETVFRILLMFILRFIIITLRFYIY